MFYETRIQNLTSVLIAFIDACKIHAINPYKLLAIQGIEPQIAKDNTRTLDLEVVAKLLDSACQEAGSYSFAITFASKHQLFKLDEITIALARQEDLYTLTFIFNALLEHQSTGPKLSLSHKGSIATYQIRLPVFKGVDMTPLKLVILTLWNAVMTKTISNDWSPIEFTISGKVDSRLTEGLTISGKPLSFNNRVTAIKFDAKLINQKLSFNPSNTKSLVSAYSKLLSEIPLDKLVADLLSIVIFKGGTSLEHITSMLGTTPRQLQRNLKVLNTNYSDILSTVRLSIAKELLENSSYKVSDISFQLDFNSSEAFVRFFKERANITPLQWRKLL